MNRFLNLLINQLSQIEEKKLNDLKELIHHHNDEILLLGNGGSNAICSHIAEDYTKALKKKANCFSDAARLTCYANDYGYENAFCEFLKEFTDSKSLVILISSSGNSKNILNCAEYCKQNKMKYITLSGFDRNNKLRQFFASDAVIDFWIDSNDYGVVECAHEIILHSVI